MFIPRQLLSYLNSGKCFALVGSGLSTGMGYPSWKGLAQAATQLVTSDKREQQINRTTGRGRSHCLHQTTAYDSMQIARINGKRQEV